MYKTVIMTLILLNSFLLSQNLEPTKFYLDSLPENEKIEMIHYLNAFPYSDYKIYKTHGIGYFYVDDLEDCIKKWIALGYRWEEYMLRFLSTYIKPGTIAIDIGAHMGLHTIFMAQCVKNQGIVYAFEPQKKLYRELVMNIGLNKINNIRTYRYALGNDEKIVQMNLPTPCNEGGTGIGYGGDSVQLTKLDNFHLTNVSLIKIDVEGFENEVLDGAKETIQNNRPIIIIEILGGNDYNTAPQYIKDMIDYTKMKLSNLGYKVTKISVHDYLAIPEKK